MKTLFATIIIGLITMPVMAQEDAISKYFSELEDDRSNTVITISGMMFKLFQSIDVDDEEDQETLDAMSKLTGLKMLSKDEVRDGFAYYRSSLKKLPRSDWEEWMTVREEDSDLSFLIHKNGQTVTELLMIIGSEDSFFMMSIMGDIDMNQISKISKSMNIDGLDDLEKINKKKN